jgi:hypothetical protein
MFKQPRQHNDAHLEFVRQLPCVVCADDTATEAAHLRAGNLYYGKKPSGLQIKPSDKWVLPLCGKCHRAQHSGNEAIWWARKAIDPWVLSLSLYGATGDYEMAVEIIRQQTGLVAPSS